MKVVCCCRLSHLAVLPSSTSTKRKKKKEATPDYDWCFHAPLSHLVLFFFPSACYPPFFIPFAALYSHPTRLPFASHHSFFLVFSPSPFLFMLRVIASIDGSERVVCSLQDRDETIRDRNRWRSKKKERIRNNNKRLGHSRISLLSPFRYRRINWKRRPVFTLSSFTPYFIRVCIHSLIFGVLPRFMIPSFPLSLTHTHTLSLSFLPLNSCSI